MDPSWETHLRSHILPAVAPSKPPPLPDPLNLLGSNANNFTDPVGEAECRLLWDPRFRTRRTFIDSKGKPYELKGVVFAPTSSKQPHALVDKLVKAVTKAAADGDQHLQQIPTELLSNVSVLPGTYDTVNSATAATYGCARQIADPLLKSQLFTAPRSEPVALQVHNVIKVDYDYDEYEEVDMSIAAAGRGTKATVLSVIAAKSPYHMTDHVFDTLDEYARSHREFFAHLDYDYEDGEGRARIHFEIVPPPFDEKKLTYEKQEKVSNALGYGFRGIVKAAAVALCTDTHCATITNWSRYTCVDLNNNDKAVKQKVLWTLSAGRRQGGELIERNSGRGVMDGTPSPIVLLLAAAYDKFERLGRRIIKPIPESAYCWTDEQLIAAGLEPPQRKDKSRPAARSKATVAINISAATPSNTSARKDVPSGAAASPVSKVPTAGDEVRLD